MNYEELIADLRYCADTNAPCSQCKYLETGCDMAIAEEAADAIEELQKCLGGVQDAHNEGYDVGYWAGRRDYEPKWIPVTERLPKEYIRVIGFMTWKAITAIEYQDGKWYLIDHSEPLPNEAVTHWMPLPAPPKEES